MASIVVFPKLPRFVEQDEGEYAIQKLLNSEMATLFRQKLSLSKINIKLDTLLEYMLAFYMYPHFKTREDANDYNTQWIENTLRPSLYRMRTPQIQKFFDERLSEEEELKTDPITLWETITQVLQYNYILPSSLTDTILTAEMLNPNAKRQYELLVKNPTVRILPTLNETSPVMSIFLTLMTLFVFPSGLNNISDDVVWTSYWTHITGKPIRQETANLRRQLFSKVENDTDEPLEFIHPELFKVLLDEIRNMNESSNADATNDQEDKAEPEKSEK